MNKVYLLYHGYEFSAGMETKILGVYSSCEKAENARDRYFKLEGFCDFPKNCFYINEFELDKDSEWFEGFEKWDKLDEEFRYLTEIINRLAGIGETPEISWKDTEWYSILCEISDFGYGCDDAEEFGEHICRILKTEKRMEFEIGKCVDAAKEIFGSYCDN